MGFSKSVIAWYPKTNSLEGFISLRLEQGRLNTTVPSERREQGKGAVNKDCILSFSEVIAECCT